MFNLSQSLRKADTLFLTFSSWNLVDCIKYLCFNNLLNKLGYLINNCKIGVNKSIKLEMLSLHIISMKIYHLDSKYEVTIFSIYAIFQNLKWNLLMELRR